MENKEDTKPKDLFIFDDSNSKLNNNKSCRKSIGEIYS